MEEFDQIYKTYFHDVFLYVRSLSKSESIAEEVTSETFFKALRAVGKFRGECDIRIWLCQIAKNCYYTYLKKHPALANLEEAERANELQSTDTVEERIIDKSKVMQIHRLLHDLNEPYKEVFTLRVFGELGFREIGDIFGKTDNWACVTYHRARSKIIDKMEGNHDEK